MIQKYFEEEIQKNVSGICRRKERLEAYKLYFGFRDCLLVKKLSIGDKG